MRTGVAVCGVSLLGCVTLLGCAGSPHASGKANADPVRATEQARLAAHIHDGTHVVAENTGTCEVCNVYEVRKDSVVRIRNESGLGTGVVFDDAGSILTNAHVVGDSKTVAIETYRGTIVRGTVERANKELDLAVVRVSSPDVKWSPIAPTEHEAPAVGSTIYVIGHPAGLGWTLTTGVLSGRRAKGEVQKGELYQISAAVSPGNSGGPAFDALGHWIGTVSSKLVGPGLEGISFVIPASELRAYLAEKPAVATPNATTSPDASPTASPAAK